MIHSLKGILEAILCVESKTPEHFQAKLGKLSVRLASFKRSLEYIQDFIHFYGLKVFHEGFESLVRCYVDIEKNYLLTGQMGFEELSYDEQIPMPEIKNKSCNTFIGWVLEEILHLTHPQSCTYLQSAYGFYDCNSFKESLTLKTLFLLVNCIGVTGL